jgi:hypothetical protein
MPMADLPVFQPQLITILKTDFPAPMGILFSKT